jgi:hypothetical protein
MYLIPLGTDYLANSSETNVAHPFKALGSTHDFLQALPAFSRCE